MTFIGVLTPPTKLPPPPKKKKQKKQKKQRKRLPPLLKLFNPPLPPNPQNVFPSFSIWKQEANAQTSYPT